MAEIAEEEQQQKKVSKKQQACVNRYISKSYDKIDLTVAKGTRNDIRIHAENHGESVNAFIRRAITETMARDNDKASTD